MPSNSGLVWLRRDLRLHDHHAMRMALKACQHVWVVFVFDTDILSYLLDRGLKKDRRIDFIWQSLQEIDTDLRTKGGGLIVRHGKATEIIPQLRLGPRYLVGRPHRCLWPPRHEFV